MLAAGDRQDVIRSDPGRERRHGRVGQQTTGGRIATDHPDRDPARGRVYALAESAHAYERALDLWDAVPPDDRPADTDIVDLFHEATMALVGIGQLRRARELSKQAVERFPVEADPLKAAMLRERYARTMWLTSDLTEALAVLDEAVELTRGQQTEESARVLASLAGLHVLQDHTALAIELGREAVEQARAVGSPAIEAYAICGLGVALVNRGDCDEGLALLRRGIVMVHEERLSAIDASQCCRARASSPVSISETARLPWAQAWVARFASAERRRTRS